MIVPILQVRTVDSEWRDFAVAKPEEVPDYLVHTSEPLPGVVFLFRFVDREVKDMSELENVPFSAQLRRTQ